MAAATSHWGRRPMSLRKLLLQIMLWSLATAALMGVVAVFIGDADVMGRVVVTAVATAGACGLLTAIAPLIEGPATRPAGLLGMAAVIVEFLLALLLIWEIPRLFFGRAVSERVMGTIVLVAAAALPAMGLLRLRLVRGHRPAGDVGLGIVLAAFGCGVLWLWGGLPTRTAERWALTGWALVACGAPATVALAGFEGGRTWLWRWLGLAAATAALGLWLLGIWTGIESAEGTVAFTGLLCCAAVVALANLLRHCPLPAAQHWLPITTVAVAIVDAALSVFIVAREQFFRTFAGFDVWGRLTAAAGIAVACGTLATLVLSRVGRRAIFEPTESELASLTVICPRCGKRQTLPVGGARCQRCGLRICVRIEDPRCPTCGYLLYGTDSDRCPECGTPIRAAATAQDAADAARA